MNVFHLTWKNLRFRPVSTFLTVFSVTVGVTLVLLTLHVRRQSQEHFHTGSYGYDLLVGAKGSPLQLVLNTLYNLDRPIENIPLVRMWEIRAKPEVEFAVPFSLGDNFRGHRLVGTDSTFFEHLRFGDEGIRPAFSAGRPFRDRFECVAGSAAARQAGLRVGDRIHAVHGLEERITRAGESVGHEDEEVIGEEEGLPEDPHESHAFLVTGTLEETGTPIDKALLVDYRSILTLHDLDGSPRQEITSLAVKMRSPTLALGFRQALNKGSEVQAVLPYLEIDKLFKTVGRAGAALLLTGYVVTFMACLSIFLAIYNSLKERKRSLSILRALGAGHAYLFLVLFLESACISLAGCLLGLLSAHVLIEALHPLFSSVAGMEMTGWKTYPEEWATLAGIEGVALALSSIPGLLVYRRETGLSLMDGP